MRVPLCRERALPRLAGFLAVLLVPTALAAAPLGGSFSSNGAVGVRGGSPHGLAARGGYGAGPRAFGAQGHGQRFHAGRSPGYGSYVIPPAYASAGFPPYVYGGYGYAPYAYGTYGAGAPARAYPGAYDGNAGRVLDGAGASLSQGSAPPPYAPPTTYRIADRDGRGGGPRVTGPGTGFQGADPTLPRVITIRP